MAPGMSALKPITFHGASIADLRAVPVAAGRELGHQIDRVHRGLDPDENLDLASQRHKDLLQELGT